VPARRTALGNIALPGVGDAYLLLDEPLVWPLVFEDEPEGVVELLEPLVPPVVPVAPEVDEPDGVALVLPDGGVVALPVPDVPVSEPAVPPVDPVVPVLPLVPPVAAFGLPLVPAVP